MPFQSRCYKVPKDSEEGYEDAYAVHDASGVAAIADGVAEGIFCAQWAKLLTQSVVQGPPEVNEGPMESFLSWLEDLRVAWADTIDIPSILKDPKQWNVKQKLKRSGGGLSTLLWIEVTPCTAADEVEAAETEGDVEDAAVSSEEATETAEEEAAEGAPDTTEEVIEEAEEPLMTVDEEVESSDVETDALGRQTGPCEMETVASEQRMEPAPGNGEDPDEQAQGWQFSCYSLGDCSFFHVRDGRLLKKFPLECAKDFEKNPKALCSTDRWPTPTDFDITRGYCETGDLIVLTTDAIGAWAYKRLEAGNPVCWNDFWGMSDEQFAERIRDLREDNQMRYDDTTLVLLKVSPTCDEGDQIDVDQELQDEPQTEQAADESFDEQPTDEEAVIATDAATAGEGEVQTTLIDGGAEEDDVDEETPSPTDEVSPAPEKSGAEAWDEDGQTTEETQDAGEEVSDLVAEEPVDSEEQQGTPDRGIDDGGKTAVEEDENEEDSEQPEEDAPDAERPPSADNPS